MPAPSNLTSADLCTRVLGTIDYAAIQGGLDKIKADQQFLATIRSAENRSKSWFSNIDKIEEQDGKLKVLSSRYLPKTCPGGEDNTQAICEGGVAPGFKYADLSIRQPTLYGNAIKFKWADIRTFCEGKNEFMNMIFAKNRDDFRTRLNYKLEALMVSGLNHTGTSYVGNFANGVAGPKTIPLFFANPDAFNRINPVGESIIEHDMVDAGMSVDNPYTIGYGIWMDYFKAKGRNSTSNTGDNAALLNALMASGYRLDKHIDIAYGTQNNAWVIEPGVLQLLAYNKNVGDFMLDLPHQQRGTLADNLIPGLLYDYTMNWNICGDDIEMIWQLSLKWDLAGLPNDIYALNCDNTGVNGVYHYIANCADTAICAAVAANNPARPVVDINATRVGAVVTVATTSTPSAPLTDIFTIDIGGHTFTGLGTAAVPVIPGIAGTIASFTVDTAVYLQLAPVVAADVKNAAGIISIGDYDVVPES